MLILELSGWIIEAAIVQKQRYLREQWELYQLVLGDW